MIVEWFLDLCAGVLGMLADAFGPWEPPTELVDASEGVNGLLTNWSGMSVWVEWTVLAACVGVQIAVWAGVVGIKGIRAIAAHIPQFGGAGD